MITIVVVDDHKVVRQGIRSLLESESDLRVVGEAGDGLDALRVVLSQHPNVLVTDLSMKGMDGIELCEEVRASIPTTECIVLSMYGDKSHVERALSAGVKGYVLKEDSSEELVTAIRLVAMKRIFMSKALGEQIAQQGIIANSLETGKCLDIIPSEPNQTEPKISQDFNGFSTKTSLEEQIQVLQELALMDELTRVGNRRFANISLVTKINELKRYGWPFGVILFDIDNFKCINDIYGHDAGDEVLRTMAKVISRTVRSRNSSFFRWGGDEFLIIASNVDDRQILEFSERIRESVATTSISLPNETVRMTISLGMTLADHDDEPEKLIRRVDEMLYRSKKEGKNRSSCGQQIA